MKFLTLEKESFGLDVSDLSLKIMKLKKRGDLFRVDSFGQMSIEAGVVEKGLIKNEDALAKIIKVALKNIQGKKIRTKYVIVSLPEEKSFLQVIQMPKMEKGDLRSAIFFEAENYIPLPIGEVYLDFQIIEPVNDSQNHLDVLMVAMPKKIVNTYVSCLKKAGLIPLAFEIESEAIARALIKNETSNAPVALIDFGKNSTDFIVFSGRSIRFTYSIPISSEQLTAAISKSLGIDLEEAEKIKLKYNLSRINTDERLKKTLEAIAPILEDLAAQVKKNMNFYQDHAPDEHVAAKKIEKIFLCGGGANLKGLPEFLSRKLNISVELHDTWMHFLSQRLIVGANANFLSFTTALGLAMRGIENNLK